MAEIASSGKSGKVVIQNIGLLLSGDIDKPILDADTCLLYTSPSPRDQRGSRMPSSA